MTELDSALDLVAVEKPGNESLRLFIDHPEGIDLALCEGHEAAQSSAGRLFAGGLLAGAEVQPHRSSFRDQGAHQ